LRAENRVRVFENRVLNKIFGPKRAEVNVEWRILRYVERYDVYSSTNVMTLIK
jgi:hypothetical protein